jgi:hypothetical protein
MDFHVELLPPAVVFAFPIYCDRNRLASAIGIAVVLQRA